MPDHAPEAGAREFAAAFSAFLNWIHEIDQEASERNPGMVMAQRRMAGGRIFPVGHVFRG